MKALTCGRVVVGDGAVVEGPCVVLVEDGRLEAVGTAEDVPIPGDAEIIDASDRTVIPGLIDCHLHLTQWNVLTFDNYRVAAFEISPQLQQLYALLHAQMCLDMGFTTLRDLGGNGYAGSLAAEMVAVRDAINLGIHAGPRLVVAGFTVATGSHLDLIMPRNAIRAPGVTADGPWGLRELARRHLRTGVDLLKTCASGGGGTDKEEPDVRNMTQKELDAIADEAHAANKRCACHAFTPEAQKMAMRARVDSLEHCVFTDDEAVKMILDTGTPLVPTLAHRSDKAIEQRRAAGTPEFVLEKMKRIQPLCWETFQRLHAAGVTMAMGTDTQIDPDMGGNAYELEIYTELGMSPAEALATATKNAADVLGIAAGTGTLEAGKTADLVALFRNPLDDITVLQERRSIELVMKDGSVVVDRRPGHPTRSAVHREAWDWAKPC
ncbi:amidohydrolase family protein [Amycolatopsis sp. K13G38]|uniref:Amidohydrolase family protein n=1 Tax=Amycolatopsis acididurans TaxID=2724524 RepID=A0ABX1JFQ9_9PSEU|nr:amidohydrolase family protein [Amycolatopsis acididurans]NKQ58031.1 amidohydrolase family protein [Amycolatopsis acididurans]